MALKDWVRKVTDLIMPFEPTEEEDEIEEKKPEVKAAEKKQAAEVKEVRRAAGGGAATGYAAATMSTSESGTMAVGGKIYRAYDNAPETEDRPSLKIVKSPEFSVKIYHSANGSQVCAIADDILGHKAAVVNYEQLEDAEQRRICDFINGVCYASDGSVRMISERIFLYVPAGINSEDIAMAAASVYAHGHR